MTLNGQIAFILRYFAELGSFLGVLRESDEDIPKLSSTKM